MMAATYSDSLFCRFFFCCTSSHCEHAPVQSNKNVESTGQPNATRQPTFNDSRPMGIDEVDHQLAHPCDSEEFENILAELEGTKRQLNSERLRVSELEDQLSSLSKCTRQVNGFGVVAVKVRVSEYAMCVCVCVKHFSLTATHHIHCVCGNLI